MTVQLVGLKGQTYSFFSHTCHACSQETRCISAGSFSTGLRQFFLNLRGFELKETELMLAGKKRHEEELVFMTIDQYGYDEFQKDLEAGEEIILKEVPVCSRTYGLKGIIDELAISKEVQATPNRYYLKVTEIKTIFAKEYLLQSSCYGLILSDIDCSVRIEQPLKARPEETRRIMKRLYPENSNITLDIDVEMQFGEWSEDGSFKRWRTFKRELCRKNLLTKWGAPRKIVIEKRVKNLRHYYPYSYTAIEAMPYCRYCKKDDKHCSLWSEICAPIGYMPLSHGRQYTWGKRGVIIKKPPLKVRKP